MKATSPTEVKDLLLRLRDGEEQAFATIYDRYNQFLYLQAHKLTQDGDDAQDIVQDIFLHLWDNRQTLDIRAPLAVYLSKSVRFGFLKKVRAQETRTRYAEELAFFMERGTCTTDEVLLERELVERLKALAASLPTKAGQAFILKNLEAYSIAEIAEALDVSPKTVSNLLSQANKDLKLKLGISLLMAILSA